MAPTYKPGSHTNPETAKVGSVSVVGVSPGVVFVQLADDRSPSFVFLPTTNTSDGYPSRMIAVATKTGTIS